MGTPMNVTYCKTSSYYEEQSPNDHNMLQSEQGELQLPTEHTKTP